MANEGIRDTILSNRAREDKARKRAVDNVRQAGSNFGSAIRDAFAERRAENTGRQAAAAARQSFKRADIRVPKNPSGPSRHSRTSRSSAYTTKHMDYLGPAIEGAYLKEKELRRKNSGGGGR